MSKPLKTTFAIVIAMTIIIVLIVFRFWDIKKSFQIIEVNHSIDVVLEEMGQPSYIRPTFSNDNAQDWVYAQFPIPEDFVLTIENNKVQSKSNNISP